MREKRGGEERRELDPLSWWYLLLAGREVGDGSPGP